MLSLPSEAYGPYEWLCHSIKGRAHYHLGQREEALESLTRAEELLAPELLHQQTADHHLEVMASLRSYLDKIEHD